MRETWKPILKREPFVHHDYYDKVSDTGYLISSLGRVKRRWRIFTVRNDKNRVLWKTHPEYDIYAQDGIFEYRERIVKGSLIQMDKKEPKNNYRHYRLSRCFQFGIDESEFYYGHILCISQFLSKDLIIPDNLEVNHKDGNKDNNAYNNLELVTHSDNILHCIHELNKFPGIGPLSTLSEEEKLKAIQRRNHNHMSLENIYRIRRIYDRGLLSKQVCKLIGKKLGYAPTAIRKIATRESYSFISEELKS